MPAAQLAFEGRETWCWASTRSGAVRRETLGAHGTNHRTTSCSEAIRRAAAGKVRCAVTTDGHTITLIPGGKSRFTPDGRVLEHEAGVRCDAKPACDLEVDVRRRLPARSDLGAGRDGVEPVEDTMAPEPALECRDGVSGADPDAEVRADGQRRGGRGHLATTAAPSLSGEAIAPVADPESSVSVTVRRSPQATHPTGRRHRRFRTGDRSRRNTSSGPSQPRSR